MTELDSEDELSMTNEDKSLAEKIRESLLVEEPDEDALFAALEDAVEIVDGSWAVRLTGGVDDREPKDRVFTYLLGKYAAFRVSEGTAPLYATKQELLNRFDESLVEEIIDHGWVRSEGENIQIRGEFYKHTADELAARYADE